MQDLFSVLEPPEFSDGDNLIFSVSSRNFKSVSRMDPLAVVIDSHNVVDL